MNYLERIQLNKKIASRDFVIIAKFFSLLQNGLAYKEGSENSLHIASTPQITRGYFFSCKVIKYRKSQNGSTNKGATTFSRMSFGRMTFSRMTLVAGCHSV